MCSHIGGSSVALHPHVTDLCDLVCSCSGLEGGTTYQPAIFTVETRGAGQGGLGLAIEGPSEAKMTCRDNRDGSCTVEYLPTKKGDYDIKVKFADVDIPGSPFKARIVDPVNAGKVHCYGEGIDPKGVRAGAPTEFTVDAVEAGDAPLEVVISDPQTGKMVLVFVVVVVKFQNLITVQIAAAINSKSTLVQEWLGTKQVPSHCLN